MKHRDRMGETANIERVAEDYRSRGYDVVISPSPADLPDFLRDVQADILARKKDDSVLIEVKHSIASTDTDKMRSIAQKVAGRPGWRFVLVSPPPDPSTFGDERYESLQPSDVPAMLAEALALGASHPQASLLLAWSVLEAAMRIAAERHELHPARWDAASLMRELVSNGILEREAYAPLNAAFNLRNAVAHGHAPKTAADFQNAIDLLRRVTQELLRDLDRPETEAQR